MALPKIFHVNDDAPTASLALLAIRFLAGLTLFVNSGLPKLAHLSQLANVPRGALPFGGLFAVALGFATLALGPGTLLLTLGLATRYAAAAVSLSLAGTFFVIDHALTLNLLDPGHNSHPEVIWLYMMLTVALVLAGPGRYSLDQLLTHKE